MVDLAQFVSVGGIALVCMVLVQIFKQWVPLTDASKKWISVWSLACGLVLGVGLAWGTNQLGTPAQIVGALLTGLLGGASAVGLYENTLSMLK